MPYAQAGVFELCQELLDNLEIVIWPLRQRLSSYPVRWNRTVES
jgi:hypothetical protein